jgi:hypothetical protein
MAEGCPSPIRFSVLAASITFGVLSGAVIGGVHRLVTLRRALNVHMNANAHVTRPRLVNGLEASVATQASSCLSAR